MTIDRIKEIKSEKFHDADACVGVKFEKRTLELADIEQVDECIDHLGDIYKKIAHDVEMCVICDMAMLYLQSVKEQKTTKRGKFE